MSIAAESRVLLRGIHWETYERLDAEIDTRNPRLTYDAGELEIMSVSRTHERFVVRLERAIDTIAELLGVPLQSGGAMSFRSEPLAKGFQPDACYWIQNAARVREEREFDPSTDPPPDLVLEIEPTRSALDELAIFAALGVGEVWRYDGDRLTVHVRDASGTFVERRASGCFPTVPFGELESRLAAAAGADEMKWLRSFRTWVQTRLAPDRRGG